MFFSITSYVTGIASLSIAAFVYYRKPASTLTKLFCFLTISVAVYSIFLATAVLSATPEQAMFWMRIEHLGNAFIPTAYLHFSLAVIKETKKWKPVLFISYLASFLLVPTVLTNLWIGDVRRNFAGLNFYPHPGPLYAFYFLMYCAIFAFAQTVVFLASRRLKGREGKQALFVFWSGFLGSLAGSVTFLPLYGVEVSPNLNSLAILYLMALAYAILKHGLLDIQVLIKKTLVFAGLFSFAFGIFTFTTFLTQEVLSAYVTGTSGRVLSIFLSVFLIVLGYDPLRKFLVNLTDRFLFQKKYDYRKFLRDASAGISQIKSLNHLLSLVTHFVTMRIRVRSAAILMYDEKNRYFKFAYLRGYPKLGWLRQGHVFAEGDPLIDYLKYERLALDIERVKEYAETGGPKPRRGATIRSYDFKMIQARMDELQAACCVPSFLGDNLRNVLILGEKKSGDFYSDEDLQVLFTLAQESAIAIENARLYDQAIEKAKELEKINAELNTAQTNLIRALNDTEVANKRLRDTHAQLIHEQKMATLGRLASSVGHEVNNPLTILSMNVSRAILKYRQNPDLKVMEVLDIFQKMEQNISRIKAVVNTLTGLLKKSEHGKFEPLSLKLILEETLPLVQFQTYLENLSGTEVVFDIPANTPLIKGDLERLQEVFLNLFINAYHAMAGKQQRKITVTAHESPAHPAMVMVEFSDNGSGMTDEVMKKVFSYGFTTKPAGKGSGMGLYMCRYIIELHGGEVKVRSKLGEGTTFAITLPIYYEPTSAVAVTDGKD